MKRDGVELKNHKVIFNGLEIGLFNGKLTLLENFNDSGIEVPYLCCAGECGCCKMLLLSGTVSCKNQTALSHDERQNSVILACCAYLQSDIELTLY